MDILYQGSQTITSFALMIFAIQSVAKKCLTRKSIRWNDLLSKDVFRLDWTKKPIDFPRVFNDVKKTNNRWIGWNRRLQTGHQARSCACLWCLSTLYRAGWPPAALNGNPYLPFFAQIRRADASDARRENATSKHGPRPIKFKAKTLNWSKISSTFYSYLKKKLSINTIQCEKKIA